MSNSKVDAIIKLMNDINEHPSLDKALIVESEDGFERRFLTPDNDGIPCDLVKLINTLNERLDSDLISEYGSHSSNYYILRNSPGVRVMVLEKDSFGPLIVGVKHINGNWWVTYG